MGVHWGCRGLGDIVGIGETVTLKLAQVSSEVTEVWVRLDGWEMRFTTIVPLGTCGSVYGWGISSVQFTTTTLHINTFHLIPFLPIPIKQPFVHIPRAHQPVLHLFASGWRCEKTGKMECGIPMS